MAVKGQVVLITGASSGIGESAAHLFAKEGARLSLAARRLDHLEKLAARLREGGAEVIVRQTDVSELAQVKAWVSETLAKYGCLDILVNNAGVGCVGRVGVLDLKYMRQVMDVNYFGVLSCIQEVLPQMRKQKSGHIINISSIIGKRAMPDIGGYCASKFALHGATDALRLEVKNQGIHVTTVCPGLTQTQFAEKQLRPERMPPLRTKMKGQEPEVVARAILRATKTKAREVHLTAGGIFLVTMERFSPRAVDWLLGFRERFVSVSN